MGTRERERGEERESERGGGSERGSTGISFEVGRPPSLNRRSYLFRLPNQICRCMLKPARGHHEQV